MDGIGYNLLESSLMIEMKCHQGLTKGKTMFLSQQVYRCKEPVGQNARQSWNMMIKCGCFSCFDDSLGKGK